MGGLDKSFKHKLMLSKLEVQGIKKGLCGWKGLHITAKVASMPTYVSISGVISAN